MKKVELLFQYSTSGKTYDELGQENVDSEPRISCLRATPRPRPQRQYYAESSKSRCGKKAMKYSPMCVVS